MLTKTVRLAVTGAAGSIGYALLFRVASGEMFGPKTKVELRLLELENVLPRLQGVKMELEDCAFPLLEEIVLTKEPEEAFEDVDWALLVGSVPRKAGMERKDLLQINAKVFIEQGMALNKSAKPTTKILVVGNPCNTNAFIAKEMAPQISPQNFFAMTMLDQKRACTQLAQKAQVEVSAVKNVAVWGNHSSTQYVDFYHAQIHGDPLLEVISDEEWLKSAFLKAVQQRGSEIIKARRASSAASAANAIIETVKAVEKPTPSGEWFSLGVVSDGSYGIPEGTVFSFPVASDGKEWEIVQGVDHNDFAKEKIQETLKELMEEKQSVQEILSEM